MNAIELKEILSNNSKVTDVDIVKSVKLPNGSELNIVNMNIKNAIQSVPVITYPESSIVAIPAPRTKKSMLNIDTECIADISDKVSAIEWRVNGKKEKAIMLDGLPVVPKTVGEINAVIEKTNRRIGNTIRAGRINKNMTLRNLSNLCGIGASHLATMERGFRPGNIRTIAAIADVLGYELRLVKKNVPYVEEKITVVDETAE